MREFPNQIGAGGPHDDREGDFREISGERIKWMGPLTRWLKGERHGGLLAMENLLI